MKLRSIVAGFGVLASSSYSFADDELQIAAYSPAMGDDVLVTAARSPVALKDTLASASIITREDIEKSQAKDVYQVLRNLAGVKVTRNGGRGAATNVGLRGVEASGTLVMVDGVSIESATLGEASLENLSLDQIERIEVVRGPKSSLYGSQAMGGVIQIFTRKSSDPGVNYSIGAGSHGTLDTSISASGASESSRFNLTASHEVSDGFDTQYVDDETAGNAAKEEDGFHRSNLSINIDQDITELFSANLLLTTSKGQTDYDTPYAAADTTPYSEKETKLYSAALIFDNDRLRSSLRYGNYIENRTNYLGDGTDFNYPYETQRQSGTWENSFKANSSLTLNAGLDYTHEEIDTDTAYDQTRRDNFGGYLNSQVTLGKALISAGFRHDDNEQFGSKITGDLAFGYEVLEDVIASISGGTAYKAPSFNDLYYPLTFGSYGVPTLVPEEIKSIELGLDVYKDWGSASARVYKSEIENKTDWVEHAQYQYHPEQVDEADIHGVELQASTEFEGYALAVSATYESVTDADTGEDLERHPRRRVSFDVDRSFGKTDIGFTFYAQSRHYDGEDEYRENVPGYGDLAFRVAHRVSESFKVRARVDNSLDSDYIAVNDYNNEGRVVMIYIDYTPD